MTGKARMAPAERRALLEQAACACIAEGGMRAFTVDRVAAQAGVSRGLIPHHYGSMEGLLVAVYGRMYRDWIAAMKAPRPGLAPLDAIVEALVSPAMLDCKVLAVWLALWGEVAANPVLRAEHRRLYGTYRDAIAGAIRAAARDGVDAEGLAAAFICLVDGWAVQRCMEPALLGEAEARRLARALLAPYLAAA
jgi:AcrR family transcriptional regulator